MSEKTPLPTGAYELLEKMIELKDQGVEGLNQTDLRQLLKKNISYQLRVLIEEDLVKSIKDGRRFALFVRPDVTMDDVIEKNRHSVKNPYPSTINQNQDNTDCPYKGRRYEDVEPGTYDPALADNRQPSRQYSQSIHGSSLMGVV